MADDRPVTALLLGGGAPTLTLQAGALAALDEHGVEFQIVSTAGAGMLIGLLYAAPKGLSPAQALAHTKEMGVHDSIYEHFPVNFKVFHKPGALADQYRRWLQSLPRTVAEASALGRLWADWAALLHATWCPTDLSPQSLGLCDHAPWIDEVVDFDQLKAFKGDFYMNAYCIDDQTMHIFDKHEISADHFRAALAFPLIYPPFTLNGKTYIEGSAIDTLCFEGVLKYHQRRMENKEVLQPIDQIVIFDVLSAKQIIRKPASLYDAWVQSIMIPLVEIARDDITIFKHRYKDLWADRWGKDGENFLLQINFSEMIPERHWPTVLDWSYSNLSTLYDIGYAAGQRFFGQHRERLTTRHAPAPPAAGTAGATSRRTAASGRSGGTGPGSRRRGGSRRAAPARDRPGA